MRLGYIGIMAAMGLMTACGTTSGNGKAPPKFDSDSYAVMAVNARRLEIVENWQMPMEPPRAIDGRPIKARRRCLRQLYQRP